MDIHSYQTQELGLQRDLASSDDWSEGEFDDEDDDGIYDIPEQGDSCFAERGVQDNGYGENEEVYDTPEDARAMLQIEGGIQKQVNMEQEAPPVVMRSERPKPKPLEGIAQCNGQINCSYVDKPDGPLPEANEAANPPGSPLDLYDVPRSATKSSTAPKHNKPSPKPKPMPKPQRNFDNNNKQTERNNQNGPGFTSKNPAPVARRWPPQPQNESDESESVKTSSLQTEKSVDPHQTIIDKLSRVINTNTSSAPVINQARAEQAPNAAKRENNTLPTSSVIARGQATFGVPPREPYTSQRLREKGPERDVVSKKSPGMPLSARSTDGYPAPTGHGQRSLPDHSHQQNAKSYPAPTGGHITPKLSPWQQEALRMPCPPEPETYEVPTSGTQETYEVPRQPSRPLWQPSAHEGRPSDVSSRPQQLGHNLSYRDRSQPMPTPVVEKETYEVAVAPPERPAGRQNLPPANGKESRSMSDVNRQPYSFAGRPSLPEGSPSDVSSRALGRPQQPDHLSSYRDRGEPMPTPAPVEETYEVLDAPPERPAGRPGLPPASGKESRSMSDVNRPPPSFSGRPSLREGKPSDVSSRALGRPQQPDNASSYRGRGKPMPTPVPVEETYEVPDVTPERPTGRPGLPAANGNELRSMPDVNRQPPPQQIDHALSYRGRGKPMLAASPDEETYEVPAASDIGIEENYEQVDSHPPSPGRPPVRGGRPQVLSQSDNTSPFRKHTLPSPDVAASEEMYLVADAPPGRPASRQDLPAVKGRASADVGRQPPILPTRDRPNILSVGNQTSPNSIARSPVSNRNDRCPPEGQENGKNSPSTMDKILKSVISGLENPTASTLPRKTAQEQKPQAARSRPGSFKVPPRPGSLPDNSQDAPLLNMNELNAALTRKPSATGRKLPPSPCVPQPKTAEQILQEQPWFKGDMDRDAAEGLLKRKRKKGCFVVRHTTKITGYSISIYYEGSIRHLHIPKKMNKFCLGTSDQQFDNVPELIKYFMNNEIELKAGGCTKLVS